MGGRRLLLNTFPPRSDVRSQNGNPKRFWSGDFCRTRERGRWLRAAEGGSSWGALDAITEAGLHTGIQLLASDSFEGRGPSSAGEAKTIEYLREELTNLGLEPGNGDSFFQAVPLVSITARSTAQLPISGTGGVTRLAYGDGFMAWTKRVIERAEIRESPMVFVGFGIVAPEYGWDDYSGLDVRGKTVVMLVNDPGFATGDPELFNGRTMTYYGRWTYKFEEAARQEAAAALIMHEAEPAGYPWTVVSSSWSGPQFDLIQEDNNMSRVSVEGWIPADIARTLFSKAGQNYDSLRSRSAIWSFSAVPLGLRASIALRNAIEHSTTARRSVTDRRRARSAALEASNERQSITSPSSSRAMTIR